MLQDNEDVNLDIAHSLYATAKELDPSRPVNTADGVWCDERCCALMPTLCLIMSLVLVPIMSAACRCKDGRSKRLRLADS